MVVLSACLSQSDIDPGKGGGWWRLGGRAGGDIPLKHMVCRLP